MPIVYSIVWFWADFLNRSGYFYSPVKTGSRGYSYDLESGRRTSVAEVLETVLIYAQSINYNTEQQQGDDTSLPYSRTDLDPLLVLSCMSYTACPLSANILLWMSVTF
ncbi:hypothetical protein PoB_004792500 [Plakobranchus ocellatus]|uniref:Uncharacterized protein n=1 Tax=Plakobranchus ocellatus TaxID=259542 RepID=A0AAV4BQN6_9GAST|nr:hypothetical protein PoB_004792500 [Plakobranchus ocellatus]